MSELEHLSGLFRLQAPVVGEVHVSLDSIPSAQDSRVIQGAKYGIIWGMASKLVPPCLVILAATCALSCAEGPSLQMREETCGDRFCADGCVPEVDNALCSWSGEVCIPVVCGNTSSDGHALPECLPGSICSSTEYLGSRFCERTETKVADRTACEQDSDCAPEPCCRPTMCVSRADEVCRDVESCCHCRMCMRCISACRCVDGCCVTEYDSDGCC